MLNNETMEISQHNTNSYTANCLYHSELNTLQYNGIPSAYYINICSLVDIYLVIVVSI